MQYSHGWYRFSSKPSKRYCLRIGKDWLTTQLLSQYINWLVSPRGPFLRLLWSMLEKQRAVNIGFHDVIIMGRLNIQLLVTRTCFCSMNWSVRSASCCKVAQSSSEWTWSEKEAKVSSFNSVRLLLVWRNKNTNQLSSLPGAIKAQNAKLQLVHLIFFIKCLVRWAKCHHHHQIDWVPHLRQLINKRGSKRMFNDCRRQRHLFHSFSYHFPHFSHSQQLSIVHTENLFWYLLGTEVCNSALWLIQIHTRRRDLERISGSVSLKLNTKSCKAESSSFP